MQVDTIFANSPALFVDAVGCPVTSSGNPLIIKINGYSDNDAQLTN
jgi:hypothetical protein